MFVWMKMEQKFIININKILIVLLILLIAFKLYFCTEKKDFFVDEIFSYGLMNYHTAYIVDDETFKNNWHTKEYFDDYITINRDEIFDLSPIIRNQLEDYHPPFYYLCLRIAATFSIGNFTKWTGLILNLLFFLGACVIVYKIGNEIFSNKYYAVILLILYGFSKFSLENVLFIRMYQLMELLMLMLIYWNLKNYSKNDLKIKGLFLYVIIVTLGCLTQYYFGLFLIGTLICNIIISIKGKNKKSISKIIIAFIITQILASIIFPGYFGHIGKSVFRVSEKEKIAFIDVVKQKSEKMHKFLKLANEHILFIEVKNIFLVILVIAAIILIIKKIRKEKIYYNYKLNFILIPSIIFWIVVTFTAPYTDLRYILPVLIYPLIIMLYLLIKELNWIIRKKKIKNFVLLAVLILYIICIPFNIKNIWYLFNGRESVYNSLKKYSDIPCIYFYEEREILENGFMTDYNIIRQFNNIYIMERKEYSIKKLAKELENVDISNGIIIIDNGLNAYIERLEVLKNIKQIEKCERIPELSFSMFSNEYYYLH